MRKNGKRAAALGMAAVMAAAALSGCQKGNGGPAGGTDRAEGDTTAAVTEAQSSGDNKLVVAIQTNSYVTDYDNNYFTKYLEDKLGIEIEFYQLPAATDEVRTKVSLMATSNDNLPDVLIVDNALTPETILEYGSSGVFLPLNEYTEDASRMPNYNAIPEEDKKVMEAAQTMADGNMYSLSKYEPETWNVTPNRMFINKAWIDKLGLTMPTTTDELKTVLKAFHDQDPNGNGVQDEIGAYGYQAGGYGQNITAALMNSFEFWNGGNLNGGLALDKDGKTVIAPFTTEGWKAGLTYMNDLYKEGLLSPAIFTDDDTQFKATLNEETNVVGLVSFGSLSNYPDAANNSNYLEMEILNPVKGPDGTNYTPYTEYSPNQEFFIFNGCKNVDLAVKLADAFYDHEASTVARFGEKGVDYTEDPAELEKMNNAYVAAGLYDKVTLAYISNYWLEPAAKTWHGVSPRYASLAEMNTVANGMVTYNPEDKTQLNAKSYEYYFDKHPEKVLPLLHYTEAEAGQIQEALSNIPTYVNQTMAEFITGARDIESGWDAYMSELKGMGLDEWQKCAQAAYDRSVE